MTPCLLDAHSALWHMFEPAKLSAAALAATRATQSSSGFVAISAITLVEARYLAEKYRIPATYLSDLLLAVDGSSPLIETFAVTSRVARATELTPRSVVPDLVDRIIGATALYHGLPLVTADAKLRASPVPTIW